MFCSLWCTWSRVRFSPCTCPRPSRGWTWAHSQLCNSRRDRLHHHWMQWSRILSGNARRCLSRESSFQRTSQGLVRSWTWAHIHSGTAWREGLYHPIHWARIHWCSDRRCLPGGLRSVQCTSQDLPRGWTWYDSQTGTGLLPVPVSVPAESKCLFKLGSFQTGDLPKSIMYKDRWFWLFTNVPNIISHQWQCANVIFNQSTYIYWHDIGANKKKMVDLDKVQNDIPVFLYIWD